MSKASNLAGFVTSIVPINNLNAGIITATSLVGDGTNLTGIQRGLGATANYTTSGIITAGTFYGDGGGLTNIGGVLEPITYNPGIAQTNVGISSNIVLTFNKPIKAGVGTITLRTGSASGTIVESFDVTSSNRLTLSAGVLTIDPTSSLSEGTTYYVVLPAGVFNDTFGTGSSAGISTYYFTTQSFSRPLFAWGLNSNGRLAQNNQTPYSSPVQIPGTTWSAVSGGARQSLATKTDGTLWSWGNNANGRLGQNNLTYYSSPVQIPGTTWSSISSGLYHSLVTKTDGTLWSWGSNPGGQLGQNNRTQYSSPVQIPGTTWNKIGAESQHSLATKTDGTLWSLGYNQFGQLGQNNRTYASSPVQIPGTTWSSIGGGSDSHSFATKTDGTLWSWGRNQYGQLGQNNQTPYSSPVQIPGTTWSAVSGRGRQLLATKTDGTLWAWGYNASGQLGQNNTTQYSSPVQIPGTTWSSVSSGYGSSNHVLATKTDGTLWSWGYNTSGGQLGQNNRADYSSPVQIPGTTWSSISAGGEHSLATKAE